MVSITGGVERGDGGGVHGAAPRRGGCGGGGRARASPSGAGCACPLPSQLCLAPKPVEASSSTTPIAARGGVEVANRSPIRDLLRHL
jgi:hypothetical protein